jgi:hypothetical protein
MLNVNNITKCHRVSVITAGESCDMEVYRQFLYNVTSRYIANNICLIIRDGFSSPSAYGRIFRVAEFWLLFYADVKLFFIMQTTTRVRLHVLAVNCNFRNCNCHFV